MSKHTKGPWIIRQKRTSKNEIQIDGGGLEITKIYVTSYTEETDKANAQLIATSPELLEVCKEALNQLREAGHYATIRTANLLQNTINKAEGRD
jgi:hypothetical protein